MAVLVIVVLVLVVASGARVLAAVTREVALRRSAMMVLQASAADGSIRGGGFAVGGEHRASALDLA